ncbi:MAG: restriction endonuclease subunit S [Methylobacter sp.]
MVRLGDIVTYLQRGKSPKYGAGPIQVIKSGQARGWYKFDFSKPQFLDPTFQVDTARILRSGDLLINSTGVGTAGRVTLFRGEGEFTVDSHITIARVDSGCITPDFVLIALAALGFSTLESMANGQSGQIELSLEIIRNIPIPLPPLPEQQRIARRLSRYDLVESRRATRIQDDVKKFFTTLSAINLRRPVGDFCKLSNERIDPASMPEHDFNYVGLEHIVEGVGEIAWTGPVKGARIKSTKNVFRKGDVLYGKLRPYLNKVWIAEFDGVCTTEMLVLKPLISPILLKYLLLHPDFVEQAKAKMSGVSLPRIKPADAFRITVPSVDSEASQLTKLVESVEQDKQRHQKKLDSLRIAKLAYLESWLT